MKLAHLMVFVPDLEAARAFYAGVLGFRVEREGEDHIAFRFDGSDLIAFRCERGTTAGAYSREARAVFVFSVPSVETAMQELEAKGVELLHAVPADGPFGRYAAFIDPFGIVHEIQELHWTTR